MHYPKTFLTLGWLALTSPLAPAADAPNTPVKLPFVVYDEKGSPNNHFFASGWMGNPSAITADEGCTNQPHSGLTCARFEYHAPAQWGGVVWQDPANDWGDLTGGYNLTGAHKLSFWARGDHGGETVHFKFGVLGADKKFPDSATGETEDLVLTPAWKAYSMDLTGRDLSRIKTGFVWTLTGQGHPVVFYLDDIRYEP